MDMIFKHDREPPEILANLITKTISGEEPKDKESKAFPSIEAVEFVVNQLKDGMLAGFNPKKKWLTMDLGNCLVNQNFMKQGLMWIPAVWFNMLFAFYHEIGHVIQVEENPKLAKLKKPTAKMEKDADEFAIGCIKDWTKEGKIPTLDEMGWIGRQIKKAINLYYPKALFDRMFSEIKPYELGAVGRIDTMSAYQEAIAEAQEDLNQDEKFGIIVDDVKYMRAEEFFDTTYSDM